MVHSVMQQILPRALETERCLCTRVARVVDHVRTHDQGLEEIAADIEEGADWTMVKPAMPYLDMIARGVEKFPNIPMVAYQVSGEYSMLKAAAKLGYLDESRAAFESLIAIKRAGAQYIITYYAKEIIEKAEEWNIKIG